MSAFSDLGPLLSPLLARHAPRPVASSALGETCPEASERDRQNDKLIFKNKVFRCNKMLK